MRTLAILWIFLLIPLSRAEEPANRLPPKPASMSELQVQLKSAQPGDLVLTPFTTIDQLSTVTFEKAVAKDSMQFLFSDKPEYFRTGNGISMQEEVEPGAVRLYLYHVPEPTGQKKIISAVIENIGNGPMTMRFLSYASPKPGGDYHQIARQAMVETLRRSPAPAEIAQRVIPAGQRAVIDPHIDSAVVSKDMLVHVLHEFEIDQPARVTVFQRDPDADSLKVIDSLPKLPRVLEGWHPSGAGRGLFSTSDVRCANSADRPIDTADGPQVFVVADGKTDPWIEGRDSIDPSSPIQNKGNYGVMYHVTLHYRSSDGRGLAALLAGNRPDNKWCKYVAAVVKINDGVNPGGVVPLPMKEKRFENLPQAVVMQTYPPMHPGGTGVIEFTYSPPGACCLPTPILLVPVEN